MFAHEITGVMEVIPIIKRNMMASFLLRIFSLNPKYYINLSRLKDSEIVKLSHPV